MKGRGGRILQLLSTNIYQGTGDKERHWRNRSLHQGAARKWTLLLISRKEPYLNYKLKFVCFLLGNFPASEFYIPTFRNTVCSIFYTYPHVKMAQTECSET